MNNSGIMVIVLYIFLEKDGYIYVSGGFNVHRLKTVERYDPVGDTWTEVQCMKNFRSHHQLIAVNNKLWAIGGTYCTRICALAF